ncbi:MAG: hypothetical protein PHW24_03080 [Candidatus Moranbacteria bacterium]|nr:hypothetical protein [Candidatus Moranbacteria bacterium]
MDYQKYVQLAVDFWKKLDFAKRFLIVASILVLVGVAVFLLNPAKKLLEMRNSQRRSDVVNILNAVYQYRIDNGGALPANISSAANMICSKKASSCEGLVDLSQVLVTEKKILSEVPSDPRESEPNISGYQIFLSSNGRINVTAPLAENNAVISLSK